MYPSSQSVQSTVSALPSPSKSSAAQETRLHTSSTSGVPSASSSVSALLPVPSPSVSTHSLTSSGKSSPVLAKLSPSRSASNASQVRSLSMSAGVLVASNELLDEAYALPSSHRAVVPESYESPSSRSE